MEGLYDCKSEVIGPGAYRFKAEIGKPRSLFLIFMLFILMFCVQCTVAQASNSVLMIKQSSTSCGLNHA